MEALYTAHVTSFGGRSGFVRSDDGTLNLSLGTPGEQEDNGSEEATNPEQLFAAAYSACFHGALKSVAESKQVDAADSKVTANVTLHKENKDYQLSVKMKVEIPGLDNSETIKLAEAAHKLCPYSKAVKGNIEVELAAG
ncbi:organic hydroperoxide resistance protein [Paenibacillaceae bacterium]|nr:organic hydroperoxide resistance protein [Paenibacillaceae bacterium]